MTVPQSPSSSPTVADDAVDFAHGADHGAAPPPNQVIPSLPPTPTLLEHYFPTTASASDSAPLQDQGRFYFLIKSLDKLLDKTVAPLTVENLKTELSDLMRDDPQAGQDFVNAIKHYVLERSKLHLIHLLDTDRTRDKLCQLDKDIHAARALVSDREQAAKAQGRMPDPLTTEELRALMPDPSREVMAIRQQVLDSALADLHRERERLETEVAQDLAKLRALRAKYDQMVQQRNAMQAEVGQNLRPLVHLDLQAVDQALAQGEELEVVFDTEDDLPMTP